MKKGMAVLTAVIIAVISVFIILRITMPIINSLLFDESISISEENFIQLNDKITEMSEGFSIAAKREMVFEIEKNYQILAFNQDENETYCDSDEPIQKPDECKSFGCICLYKDENFNRPINCITHEYGYFYNVFVDVEGYDNLKRNLDSAGALTQSRWAAVDKSVRDQYVDEGELNKLRETQYPACTFDSPLKSEDGYSFQKFSIIGKNILVDHFD